MYLIYNQFIYLNFKKFKRILMQKKKLRIKRTLSYFKKSNLGLINKIIRILSWLLPGLVIKRWMITSAIGLLTSLLGLSLIHI